MDARIDDAAGELAGLLRAATPALRALPRRPRIAGIGPRAAVGVKLIEIARGRGRRDLLDALEADPALAKRLKLPRGADRTGIEAALDRHLAGPETARTFGKRVLSDPRVAAALDRMIPPDAVRQRSLLDAYRGRPVAAGPRRWWRWHWRALGTAMAPLLAPLVYLYAVLPGPEQIRAIVERPSLEATPRADGGLDFRHPVFPIPVWMSALPPSLRDAVIEGEDRYFARHFGFSLRGIGRAVRDNLPRLFGGEGLKGGGSTITQQLARLVFLTADRSLLRKLRELLLAIKLELTLDKDEILRLYLSRAPLGNGVYGFEQAARYYFGERARDLRPYQAAMLAAMLPAPERRNPIDDLATAKRLAEARLRLLVGRGRLDANAAGREIAAVEALTPGGLKTGDRGVPRATYAWFRDWIVDEVRGLGLEQGKAVRLVLTLDPLAQVYAELAVERALRAGAGLSVGQAALLALGTDGGVLAMVGGGDWRVSQLNRTTQTYRAPASTFKPFVYLSALEAGLRADDPIDDAPYATTRAGQPWPRNFAGTYAGRTTLAEALAASHNAATVQLGTTLGLERVAATAKRLGLPAPSAPGPGYVLGVRETTMLDLVRAYAIIANRGRDVAPHGVVALQGTDGRVRYWRGRARGGRLVAEADALALTAMLKGVVERGTGQNARFARGIAGKTGTGQDNRDAWFVGYTGDVAAGIWLGNDDNAPMQGVSGGGLPARWWKNFMANLYDDRPLPPLGTPSGAG